MKEINEIEKVTAHLRECAEHGDPLDPADWKRIERIAHEQAVMVEIEQGD